MNAIEFNHVWKSFRKGESSTAMRDTIPNLFKKIAGKNGKKQDNTFWALKDVSFQVKKGEAVGIIGPNGSGKSTTLKLLARILKANRGKVKVNGRVAALIEVGAGFHGDLTGRENIFLNGAIMGMKRAEIKKKFDSIVDFAEVHEFVDTPVKRYSSGMYLRLGFAVAAHINPDVLLVDEVLAVGDGRFQTKCIDKIKELKISGVTIIFISHHMGLVRNTCSKTMLLNKGEMLDFDESGKVVEKYQRLTYLKNSENKKEIIKDSRNFFVVSVDSVNRLRIYDCGIDIELKIIIKSESKVAEPLSIHVAIRSESGMLIHHSTTELDGYRFEANPGFNGLFFSVKTNNFLDGDYTVDVAINSIDEISCYCWMPSVFSFHINNKHNDLAGLAYFQRRWYAKQ